MSTEERRGSKQTYEKMESAEVASSILLTKTMLNLV